MYGQVKNMPNLRSYAEALAHWNKIKPVRGRKDGCRPIAHRRTWSRRMRMLDDQSIVFTLFKTDVVTWHPDNSLTLEGHETRTTGQFAYCFTPDGVSLDAGHGVVVYSKAKHRWQRWVRHPDGRSLPNAELRVVTCDTGHRLRFEQRDGAWGLAPGQELRPIHYCELDRDHARALNKEYCIGELRLWVRTLTALGGELPDKAEGPVHATGREAYELVKQGEFQRGAAYLRRSNTWRIHNGTWTREERITETSYRKMRMKLYHDKGALHKKSQLIMTYAEWVKLVYNAHY